MTLSSIPAYVIRSYLYLLNTVRHSSHPNLTTILLTAVSERKVMGRELLTKDVIELLNATPMKELWRRVTIAETNAPVTPCPEKEQLPYDDGTNKQ